MADKTLYELLRSMGEQGWAFVGAGKRKHVKSISEPYIHNSDPAMAKRYFCIHHPAKDDLSAATLSKWYLMALLTADIHKRPVPHFDTVSFYRGLVDVDWKPPVRKMRMPKQEHVDAGEWELVQAEPGLLKRKPKAQAKPKPWEDKGADHDGDEVQDRSSSSDSGSGSSSGSSSSSSSSTSSSVGKKNSSSSDSDKEAAPAVPAAPPAPAAPGNEEVAPVRKQGTRVVRIHGQRIPFGDHYLTPRFLEGAIVGYQMRCTVEGHNTCGACTKEVSHSVSGSDDMSLRLLKAWVIYFHAGNTADRAEHRGDGWKSVNAMKRDGTLSSDEDLERMMRSGGPDVSLGKRRRLTGKSAASSSGVNK